MDRERFRTIEKIYHRAVELDGKERIAFLDAASGDETMRQEIESLLQESEADLLFKAESGLRRGLSVLAEQAHEDLSGDVLGHFQLIQLVGRGGMGQVYLAHDTRNSSTVAVKILPTYLTEQSSIDRFRLEARSASRISHPNIARVLEFGEENGRMFIVMEFVEGETLREKLKAHTLTFGDSIEIASQVAFALAAAHNEGVVHRDIKPENIIISPSGAVKVVDFGLAKLTEKYPSAIDTDHPKSSHETKGFSFHTEPGILIGTANYMSPEQTRGQPVDKRTDIWSWGVVLYEMLAGEAPFYGKTNSDIIATILTKELNLDQPFFPDPISSILAKCLQKDRLLRYDDASDLANDLRDRRSAFDGSALSARPVPLIGHESISMRSGRWARSLGKRYSRAWHAPAVLLIVVMIAVGALVGYRFLYSQKPRQIGSIAVMPIVNESGNPDAEFLTDGATEALIRSLSQMPDLTVKARNTVFKLKGKDLSAKALGDELKVEAVLFGRYADRGKNVYLDLELVSTKTDGIIWSKQYERSSADMLALQSEIARDVSNSLGISVNGTGGQKLSRNYTKDHAAYMEYMLGRFYWSKRTANDIRRSVDYFKASIERDPNFALAYSGLADSFMLLPSYAGVPPGEAFPMAEAAAKKALEIDESLAEAHTSLSFAYFCYEWKFAESDEHIRRAIELNPSYATALHWYGNVNLLAEGKFDESIEALKAAQEIDPLSMIISADLATSYLYALRLDEAIEQYNRTLELDNGFYYAHLYLGRAYLLKHDLPKAMDELKKASDHENDPRTIMVRSRVFAEMGRRSDALKMLKELKEMQQARFVSNFHLAAVYVGLGEKDLAFESLEKAFKDHDTNLIYLNVDPLLAELKGDPRFTDLVNRIGIPN